MTSDSKSTLFSDKAQALSKYILHSPTKFARENLLYLQEAGILQAVKPYATGRSGLDSYLFFHVLSGSGEFIYEGSRFPLKSGDCVFIDCRKKYSQISSGDLWTLRWVHFNGSGMDKIYRKYLELGGTPVFATENGPRYLEILDSVEKLSQENGALVNMELSEKLMGLLRLLMSETLSPGVGSRSSRLDIGKVRDYLEEHYAEALSLEELSEIFYIDRFYLSKIFKLRYGVPVMSYLNRVRIRKSKELLRFSPLPIDKICQQVGIPEPNYFSRVFKKIEGISPSAYRSQW